MFKNFAKRKNLNYMTQTVILLSSFLFILIAIFSCIVTIFFSYRTDAMCTQLNSQALKQLAEFTDKYIFENIDRINKTYFDEEAEYEPAKKFFNNMENMSHEEMQRLQSDMFDVKKNYSFLNNIYLYNSRFDSFISTGDGIVFAASDFRNNLSIENRFFTYLDSINNDFYVPQDDNIMLRDQKGLIIYVHYVPAPEPVSVLRKQVSCVIMIIDVKDIVDFLQQIKMPGIQHFAIFDHNQKALIHSDEFPGIQEIIPKNEISSKAAATHTHGKITSGHWLNRISYIWFKSDVNDWSYMYMLSLSDTQRNIIIVALMVMVIAFLTIFIGYVLIRISSKKLYTPFNAAMQKALDNLPEDDEISENDLEILNHLIDEYGKKKKEYATMHEQYSYLSLNVASLDIIRGFTIKDNDSILKHLAAYGVDFSKKEYGLILIEFNPLFLSTFTVDQNDFILYDVVDALKESFNCVAAVNTNNTVELVVNYDEIDYPKITAKLKRLIPEKSFINIYCCPPITELNNVSVCHDQAVSMMKYSYLYGYDNIFKVSSLMEQDLDNRTLNDKETALLETLLRNGNEQKFYDECNRILTEVKSEKHSYSYAQNVVLKIFSLMCQVAKEYEIPIQQAYSYKKIINNENFDTTTMYLFEFSDNLFSKLSTKENKKKFDMINNIKNYIEEHITEDISLSSVAQQFNISVGYLSKFFKENSGQSFSKYIIEKKFARAAQVLIENPEKSVNDIANDFGYFDTAYFSRQFKAHHGVTPVQYRKLNQKT